MVARAKIAQGEKKNVKKKKRFKTPRGFGWRRLPPKQ